MRDLILEEALRKEQQTTIYDGYELFRRFVYEFVHTYKKQFKLTEDEVQKITKAVLNDDYAYETLEQAVCDELESMGKLDGII